MKLVDNKGKRENIICALVLLGVFLIGSLPAFRSGVYNGFDLWYHMGRIESIATELSNGQFPVRYESLSWYGNGYISTTMYGNILLYIPALLHIVGLSTYRCYNFYVLLINILGITACYYSFKGLFKDSIWATVSTGMYMLSGYYLSNVYMRAALGEYTAMAFLPLVVYGIYRIYFEEVDGILKEVTPLVLGATALLQSHVLSTMMVALAVFVFMLCHIKETIANIKKLVIALVVILLVNAFFIIPFIDSYASYTFNASVETVGSNIQRYGLYPGQLLGLFTEASGGRVEWSSEGKEYLRIGIVHVMALVTAIIGLVINKNTKRYKSFVVIFGIGVLAAWLSSAYFPWSIFAGDNAVSNIMRAVQYPSRYLLLQTVCWNVCGIYTLRQLGAKLEGNKQVIYSIGTLVIVGTLALAQTGVFMYTLSNRNRTIQVVEGHESIADALYLQVGTDTENLATTAAPIDSEAKVKDLGYKGKWRYISIENQEESNADILVPVFNYKYIKAFDSNGNELALQQGDNNQYKLSVAAGFNDTVKVGFVEPLAWRLSEVITFITIVGLIIWGLSIKGKR